MNAKGSYHVGSFASNTRAEIRRLDAQVDLFWPTESALLLRHGLREGMHLLDCGCGPGRLIELLKHLLPSLSCVGIEVDPLLVEAGREHLAQCGMADCAIQQGAAEAPGLPAESFDFIILRLVIEHVPDPSIALRSLRQLLKPGGRIAVISNDFDFHLRTWPPVEELDRLYAAYCASRRHDGGDPCIGRLVPRLLVESGFTLLSCEIELAHSALLGDGPFLKAEGGGIPAQLVRTGFLDEKTLDDMTRSWRAMLDTPGHSIARPLWVAVAERRDGAQVGGETRSDAPEAARGRFDQVAGGQVAGGALEQILALVAAAINREAVFPDDSLAALAIDSISAMTLQEQIRALTGVEIPVVRFFGDEPVRSLVASLGVESRLQPRLDEKQADRRDADRQWEEGEL